MTGIDDELAHKAAELAHLARQKARYPTWDIAGIKRFILEAAPRGDLWHILHATLRAASDPGNRTPAVIAKDGRHWRAPEALAKPTTPQPDPFCRRCRFVHGPDQTCEQLEPAPPTDGYRKAREALKETTE